MISLTALALRRPVTTCMFFACWVVVGLIGAERLPLERFPDIEFPGLFLQLPYRNTTPEDVERTITRPVEEALATLPGIQQMNSESSDNGAGIFLRFNWGDDLAARGVEARDKIDGVRADLPRELERITIQRFSAGDEPIITYRLSATDRDLGNSYELLERNLKRRLERLPGIARVDLYGAEQKQVRIELNAERVAAHRVDLRTLAGLLQGANFSLTAGELVEGQQRFFVKSEARLESLDAIRDFVIGPNGLRIRDIAEVVYADPVLAYGRRLNREYAVGVSAFKETGANLVAAVEAIQAEVADIRQLPEMAGVQLYEMDNAASDVKRSLNDLVEAGLMGAALSILVLYFFLRDTVMTLIVTSAVPLALTITLAVMYFAGYSLNILTLMGLMLAVGMLVDNAVVVTESIFSERAKGLDARAATFAGVGGVSLAVVAGTLTTAIVFLPNIIGEQNNITVFLSHVAITICVSLLASLLIALTLVPQLTTRLPPRREPPRQTWVDQLAVLHQRTLRFALRHSGWGALLMLLMAGSIVIPASQVKADMFPPSDGDRLFLRYNVNNVYALATVEAAVATIEDHLYAHQEAYEFESLYSYFDQGRAETSIILKPLAERRRSTAELRETIRKELPLLAIAKPSFEQQRGGAQKLSVEVWGEAHAELRPLANDAAALLRRLPQLSDVRINAEAEDWEVQVRVDRERARSLGLSSQSVAEVVAGAMRGTELRPYRTPSGEVPLLLQFRRSDRADLDALAALPLNTPNAGTVMLGTAATLNVADVPGKISRQNRRASLSIEFSPAEGSSADEAKKAVQTLLAELSFPAGYGWSFGQAFDDEAESMQGMVINLLLALALIYIVMAALFESTLLPTAIITSIAFSFIGAYWFFFLTGTTFTLMAMIGLLILMGIVVNNGIVLIHHINELRRDGMDRMEAVLVGSRDRLRPILMTAATTVLGMVPLAVSTTGIGGNGPAYFPMARAIIGGLSFATLISLWALPQIYLWLDDLRNWSGRIVAAGRRAPLAH
jgi:hydrophobic/amphiphilic exporter-1 (mainly G- bacteria), HAE1 family